ncbi:hypothetical protein GCM10022215_26510 [Nocardioides fonticola]|uniref:Aquaporin family protein n=1 Tax=Nocardioides fonticola TaxID=450363 RepID=A0ABP7XLM8_9ACTN
MTVTQGLGAPTVEATRTRASSLLLELVGTALLVAVVVSAATSGRLLSDRGGIAGEVLLGSLAAAGGILALGLAFPGVRANPLLTLLDLIADRVSMPDGVARIVAQLLGGVAGGVLALWSFYGVHSVSFDLAGIDGFHVRDVLVNAVLGGLALGLVGGAVLARDRGQYVVPAVAAVTAAIGCGIDHVTWANPAIAVARISHLSDPVAPAIPIAWVAVTVIGQVIGLAVAAALLRLAAADEQTDA